MQRRLAVIISLIVLIALGGKGQGLPQITERAEEGCFPLVSCNQIAAICTDVHDYPVVGITAQMLADDVERVTGQRPVISHGQPRGTAVVAGTLGKSQLIDGLVKSLKIDVSGIRDKWESFIIKTAKHPKSHAPLLLIIGSDRHGTAFGLTSLSEAIGVSPWYWWADVTPVHRSALYVEPGTFRQGEPSVQYRGIFINGERFGGWARWAERLHGQVGPETYKRVFELLLRLKANYLWPAMHPGTQAFNADPENARQADRYAIVMGSSHCEQMLRNNEGEWKAVNALAKSKGEKGLGDFNYITNRKTMQDYWETRVKTNGQYENTYTLGLRGIHDYPMEGANSTAERVKLMQQAIDDQRDMLRRNINKPIEEIPQVLCTYEEVLDAYHNGLQVPDDVTLLWSDDKHGYCRNLSNPEEQKRKGGAGIYYHLSYHGAPASWIWLSPLSPAFLSTELTKAYTYGARKIWVFNVGDIKPAEKELSFVMDLAWDINRWQPTEAHNYIKYWAEKTFGPAVSQDIARLMARYYRLQAGGKDAHVWFVNYTEQQVAERLSETRSLETEAELLASRVPAHLQDAYFELVGYPVRGAAMLNEYQLLARRSMVYANRQDSLGAMADANRVKQMFSQLNEWTRHYNEEILDGKWREFFNWQPYHWFRSDKIDPPIASPELIATTKQWPQPRFLSVADATSCERLRVGASAGMRAIIETEQDADVPLWIEALTPIRNFSKAPEDNVFCRVTTDSDSFEASATPINNVWHAPYVGPMWSQVGTLHLKKGINHLSVSEVKSDARIDRIFIGLWPPFEKEPRLRVPATAYQNKHDADGNHISRIEGLGYTDGVLALPFDTPSYQQIADAPFVEYALNILPSDSAIEVRTLPTLHIYAGRDACYAVQLGNAEPQVFSIHANDFTAEWRWNVLRGYASRSIRIPAEAKGQQRLRVYLLDPGIVMQEILIHTIATSWKRPDGSKQPEVERPLDSSKNVRTEMRLDTGWKFAFGNAADPQKDFGCGTEYFNYLTKANSIHNEGPYSAKFDDSKWQDVNVPHDWVTTLPYDPQASHSHGYKTVGYRYPETSVGWYRKVISIPAEDLGKHLALRFDGIFRNARVWFNGFYMGTEPSGYATQVYDVTEYVNYGGDNLICVRADATLEEGWFYEGAGIYRDAWLVKTGAVSVAPFGTFVHADLQQPYETAIINISTEVTNHSLTEQLCEVEQRLMDANGNTVGSTKTQEPLRLKGKETGSCRHIIKLDAPHLWSPEKPYLYKVETTVKVGGVVTDAYETVTGIRDIRFDADRGFLLNGQPMKLKGVNLHQDHAGVGAAMPEALMAWRIQRMKELGCNAIRSSHNPMTPAMLDLCDREGILVVDENRLTGINEEHLRLLERMIKRDRNHPCVMLWSCGNEEWGIENSIQGTRLAAAMKEHVRRLDPTRPSTLANAGGSELIKGVDVVGYNYISQNNVEDRRKQHPEWKVVGTEEFTGCGTRGIYFNRPDQPGRMRSMNLDTLSYGVENVIERGWRFYAEHDWAAGAFFWTGFDYRGEPNPLKYPATDSEFGVLDYCGFWKDEAWYLKSWWTDEPTLHIFPHWNLQGHEGEEIELWAYSNCDEVELTVNGKRLGRQKMPRYGHLKWKAVYQPGKVVATGYKNGRRIMTETIATTKPAAKLVLKTDRTTISADGRDVAVVTVEVQDSKGRIVPDACPMLTFRLEGDARILGAGNGDPAYLGADHPTGKDCKTFQIPAFNGLAQLFIQSGQQSSTLVLGCTSEGLQPAQLHIEAFCGRGL